MGAAAGPLLIASTIFQAYGQLQAGKAQAEAANFERAQYEDKANLAKIQALDEEADRRRRLSQVLASNKAASASMGTGEGRSFLAIQKDSATEAERDIGRIRLNGATQVRQFSLAASQSSLAAKSATRGGYIGAGATLLNGGYQYTQMKKS